MKRIERRHLKENPLARRIADVREFIEPRTRQIGLIIGLVAVLVLAAFVVTMVRQRSEGEAQRLLAEAMVALNARVVASADPDMDDLPAAAALGATGTFATEGGKLRAALPKLQAATDAYPDTEAGITARYHLAGALAALGQNEEAVREFAEVIARADEGSLYRRMAQLGHADAQMRAGQLDAAIESWKELAAEASGTLPPDAILIELARAYAAKGDLDEARKTFTELMDEHPTSPYASVARTELENLDADRPAPAA
jgi:tetratricopeptide (TPR) repeat protein